MVSGQRMPSPISLFCRFLHPTRLGRPGCRPAVEAGVGICTARLPVGWTGSLRGCAHSEAPSNAVGSKQAAGMGVSKDPGRGCS